MIGPPSEVPDVGRTESRSGTGADMCAIRHRTHTARRVCRLSSRGRLLLCSFRSVVGWLLLVGVQFQLRHGMLQASPFFRNQREKFDTEAALARPPHDGFADGPSLTLKKIRQAQQPVCPVRRAPFRSASRCAGGGPILPEPSSQTQGRIDALGST